MILPAILLEFFSQSSDLETYHLEIASNEEPSGLELHIVENILNLSLGSYPHKNIILCFFDNFSDDKKKLVAGICTCPVL